MDRPEYLSKYHFDWEFFDVVIGGKSVLDSKNFIAPLKDFKQVGQFLTGYGLDPDRPVSQAELFGNYQESLQFIRRYFLKEGNPEGLDLQIPPRFLAIADVRDLFLLSSSKEKTEKLWAEAILKVMHTILHIDKDLRSNYFSTIQTQIFDRFYRSISRDQDNNLSLSGPEESIPLKDFDAKSKKSRDSVIIKLLHKSENVAEELFDRVGIRIVTENKFDILRVTHFLLKNNLVIPHNIKPSRSINTIFDLGYFKKRQQRHIKEAMRKGMSEEDFLAKTHKIMDRCLLDDAPSSANVHSLKSYRSVQFTCRQLVKYRNPFVREFTDLRNLAKERGQDELAQKILNLDLLLVSKETLFFYPYEVQIVDQDSFLINTEGEASHKDYKGAQIRSAMVRLFGPLMGPGGGGPSGPPGSG